MKIKTIFVSILATLCLGMSACNEKDAPKSSVELISSEEIIPSSEELVTSSEDPITSEEPPHEHAFGE